MRSQGSPLEKGLELLLLSEKRLRNLLGKLFSEQTRWDCIQNLTFHLGTADNVSRLVPICSAKLQF